MYKIDSKTERPDIAYLENRVREMMIRGISVGNLKELYNKFISEKDAIAAEIQSNYGVMNPNSSQQLVKYISGLENAEVYEACCIDGKWTTNKDVLWELASKGYQFAIDILDYRKAKKYAESIKSMQDALSNDDRVHPLVSLSKTNRINYSSPALMNIPKPLLWHVIKPNTAGNILISADIKNQEPSILINMLNVDHLKEALTDEAGLYEHLFTKPFSTKAKLHILVTDGHEPGIVCNDELAAMDNVSPTYYAASRPAVSSSYYDGKQIEHINVTNIAVPPSSKTEPKLPETVIIETVDGTQYDVPVKWDSYDKKKLKKQGIIECTGDLIGLDIRCEGIARKEFKTSWNAMTYGASSFGIKQMCKNIDGDAIYNYFSKIPEFKEYRSNCKKDADCGKQETITFFGTKLFAGETNSNKLRRVLMDLPIQGTAADILSLLIKHSESEIKRQGLEGLIEIYYTRHDEMIFEVNKDWIDKEGIEKAKNVIKDMVEHQVDDWVPFKVEVKEVKADKLYIDDTDDIF